ncbi:MarR family winged helix-turn-helix transcriptional regulator [Alicyclobacillus fodiniaquatilis]|jgi:DNA-binding MarR family transcriptional regulator|uniref:MarR family winged helix-turn-helix transcriptional regulator n=1 Tax=Alicyclobacillus fodiniaquatilis TaxID=1661150 RepID=A0ABW4JA77_9BACL
MDELIDVLTSFKHVSMVMRQIVDEAAKEVNLGAGQLFILQYLETAHCVNMTELLGHLRMSNASISILVDKLVKRNLVQRKYSEIDRRRVVLSLSDKGHDMLRSVFAADAKLMQRLSELFTLPDGELEQLLRIHQHILLNSESGGTHFEC